MPIQDFGTPIIQSYLAGKKLRLEHEQQQKDNEYRQKALEEGIRQFQENLKLDQAKTNAENKYKEALIKVGLANHIDKIREGIATGTIPYPQQSIPSAVYQNGIPLNEDQTGIQPGQNSSIAGIYKDPVYGFELTPTQYSSPQQFAEAQGTIQEPAVESAMKKLIMQQSLQQKGQQDIENLKAQHAANLAAVNNERAERVARIQADSRLKAANINANSRITAAKLGRQSFDEGSIANIQTSLANGDYDMDELTKLVPITKGERLKIVNDMGKAGFKVLDKAQMQDMRNLGILTGIYHKYLELNDLINKSKIPAADPNIRNEVATLQNTLSYLARNIGAEKGMLSNRDIDRASGTLPSPYYGQLGPSFNQKRLEQFRRDYFNIFNKTLHNFSQQQKELLRKNFGILPADLDPNLEKVQ